MLRNIAVYLLSVFCLISFESVSAQDLRSDTIDILHTTIHLDITDFTGKQIKGYSILRVNPKMASVRNLNVDLLKLTVDSVVLNGNNLTTNYNDTLLGIDLGTAYGVNDTLDVMIFYHGRPQIDQSNWGGFYFNSGVAFNLGVGFAADPHNYGRVWFPCFDNFVERSSFLFEIISSNGKKAYCNGEFIGETILSGDTVMCTWEMNEKIPSYLVCVAVGPYAEVKWMYQGVQSNIPVLISVAASDTNKLKASFAHLNDAMDAFESAYGPYLFNKIGYSIVPFSSGAMEHASNITYPSYAVNGNLNNETLMAHELAHMWWGNLVTCERAEEMWINEGMASFSVHLFQEQVYGRNKYIDEVKFNHLNVIQYAHITEEHYWPIYGIPHQYTYGDHVYNKGASMAHNLRTYLGDNLFFSGLSKFCDDNQFKHVSSADLRDQLSLSSGTDLTDFFNDWVFGPGFGHFSIDSVISTPTPGLTELEIYVHQKKRGSDHFFNNVPLTFSFFDKQMNQTTINSNDLMSGEFSVLHFSLLAEPVLTVLNPNNELNMAVTADDGYISNNGAYDFINGKMKLEVTNIDDSVYLRIQHHWAAPDSKVDGNYRLSDYRYWKISGILDDNFATDAVFEFDGRTVTTGGNGYLDNDLLQNGSDSIILMYRKDASKQWLEYKYYKKVNLSSLPFGRMELDSLLLGEYTFANGVSSLSINTNTVRNSDFLLSPNPATDNILLKDKSTDTTSKQVLIYNAEGKKMLNEPFRYSIDIDTSQYKTGNYFVVVLHKGHQVFSGKFIVSR